MKNYIIGKIEQLTHENNDKLKNYSPQYISEQEIEMYKNLIRNSYSTQQRIMERYISESKKTKLKNMKLSEDNLFLRSLLLTKYRHHLTQKEIKEVEDIVTRKKYGKKKTMDATQESILIMNGSHDSNLNKGEKMKKYILVNIGCIECGVSSNIVGVFSSKKAAEKLASQLEESHDWRESGQNSFEVFEMPKINVVHEEYSKSC